MICWKTAYGRQPSIIESAAKYVPGINWRTNSVVKGDFSCHGRADAAILGTSQTEIVVAVFTNGLAKSPQVLRYLAKVRFPESATLEIEGQDFELNKELGFEVPGFERSKTCKGLRLDDGRTDSPHIYWDHKHRRFDDWLP